MSKKTVFVISAERKDGTIGYLKEGTTAATAMLDSDPINARHFSHEYDKSQIIDWVDRVKNHVPLRRSRHASH